MTIAANIPLYKILSEARRSHGMTQSALAKEVECKQSAISMMERGKEDALAWSKIEAIAKMFDLNVELFSPKSPISDTRQSSIARSATEEHPPHYCPIFDCPANIPYVVNGKLYALPRATANPADKHCAYCGELLEKTCSECGADITAEAACCKDCGTPYITTPEEIPEGLENWSQNQRQNMKDLGL